MNSAFLVSLFFILFTRKCESTRISGRIMAFLDINADLYTDLVVASSENTISIFETQQDKFSVFEEAIDFRTQFNNSRILNVGVGDFDGDSYPDLAVSLKDSTTDSSNSCPNKHYIQICYGSTNSFKCGDLNKTKTYVCEQPLILDCDLDQHQDLLTVIEGADGKLEYACYRSVERDVFELISPFPTAKAAKQLTPHAPPTSTAFVDVTGDLNPEIVLWTKPDKNENEIIGLKVLRLSEGKQWEIAEERVMPPPREDPKLLKSSSSTSHNYIFGQSVYDDFNKDGIIDHLFSFCEPDPNSGDCGTIKTRIWMGGHWQNLEIALENGKEKWAILTEPLDLFEKASDSKDVASKTFHIRSGDYTQDGFPDLLVVLKNVTDAANKEPKSAAFLLENMPCAAGQKCGNAGRTFNVWWSKPFGSNGKEEITKFVNSASFFDLGEDGTLDIIMEYKNNTYGPIIDFVPSQFEGDTTFLKVQVFTATCSDECRRREHNTEGSAISLPGAALYYESEDTDGKPIRGSYTQRSIASYRPLLLPYAIFGLGRTPNFVEKLSVGAPNWPLSNKSWVQLVPNSRIYVVPYPVDKPNLWLHRLYVTPNRLIFYSLISLSSLCGLIIIIVFGLHMHERQMDKKERELQKEKFHFDAM